MTAPGRWLYHALLVVDDQGDPYRPASLAEEGFIHASFASTAKESASLYFPADAELIVFQIDPRLLAVPVVVVHTPRGPMPHLHGPLGRNAILRRYRRDELGELPDLLV